MKQILIFLDYFENLQKVVPLIKRMCAKWKCQPIIISSNYDTSPLSKYSDLKVIYFDELLSSQDYEFMDKYVFNLTQSWYSELRPVEGITEYKGVKFGAITEERAQRFFSSAIKKLEIVLKIIERFHPLRIILIGQKDIFQGLSTFIKEKMNISTIFIETEEKENFIRGTIKKFRQRLIEIVSFICDSLMQKFVVKRKRNNGIFIDTRLYFELKDLSKEYYPYLYLIEKGFRIRLSLIKDEGLFFAPILVDDSLRSPKAFSHFYKYWRFIKVNIEFKNKFTYKNLRIWRVLEKVVKRLIICDFPQAKKNIVFLEKLYKRLAPKVVILREAVRMPEKTIVFVAKQAKIPTLVVQHGILAGRNVYTKLHTDKIALWGKAGIDWYRAYGNDITKCVITGKPQHDILNSKKDNYEKDGKEILLKIGADPNKVTILYITCFFKNVKHLYSVYYYQDSAFVGLDSILNVAKSFPNKQLIIKVHPFDLINIESLYNNPKIKKYPNIFIVKNVDIIPLIKISSLVITSLFSSATIDAVIFNKPVITLNFYKREDLVPFAQRGVALGVAKPEHLYQTVRQIFEDRKLEDWFASNRESFIYDYAYKIDGKSKERVLYLIKDLHNGYKDERFISKSSV